MSSILSVNARGGMGLIADRAYYKMSPAQFGAWVREHHTTLVAELRRQNDPRIVVNGAVFDEYLSPRAILDANKPGRNGQKAKGKATSPNGE